VFGSEDLFLPADEGEAAFNEIAIEDKRCLILSKANGCVCDYNHVDLVMGKEAHKEVFPAIEEWLRSHPVPPVQEVEDDWRPMVAAAAVTPAEPAQDPDEVLPPEPAQEEAPAPAPAPAKRRNAAKKPAAQKPAVQKPAVQKPLAKKAPATKAKAKTKAKSTAAPRKKATIKDEESESTPKPAKKRTSRKKGEGESATSP
jgi:hypothetical protein